ncbi:hypothetical protein KPNJ1_03783 [Klebsiella pneumoniae 30660/NJST258_1]|nr:hypothetical protein KPNJ2_03770 [Klebsiella pneumoniae 30684/NJST258_2]AHM86189.1 hypothetical protein KPNJ1_03783 [Klebsiella pneumoniae 30660/NJST258_1]
MTLFLHPLILSNKLIFKIFKEKTPFAPIQPQAAYALACRRFSNSNTQGYPQE